MDAAENYILDAQRQSVYWHHHSATRYPYPLPANTPVPVAGAYNSQQIGSAANQTIPPTAGFPGHSPLSSIPTESLDHLKRALHDMRELPQMTDPPSLMASLIAVAAAGARISRTLYSFANVIGGTSEEIMPIGKEISAFSSMLRDLHDFVDDAKDLISKRALINANRILKDCKEVFTSIQQMLDSCNAGPRTNFWQNLQWTFRREKVKPMCAKLESFKLTLATLLSTMKLARCKQEGDRSGSDNLSGDSKSPNTSSKERRYRANLQTDILNNSAAIIRWQRVEIEVQSARGDDPYSVQHYATATPSKELQWLSSLVPYKPQNASSNFPSLPPIPETPDSLNEQAQVQITKTIDMLLAKWTTLYAFEKPKGPEAGGHASKSKPRHQAVAEPGDRIRDECEKESSDMSRHGSTGLTAAAPGDVVHPADSGNLQS
jgi:Fungal N-terminal domain of STAND proteins